MWAQAICAVLGIGLGLTPRVLHYGNPAWLNDQLCGVLIALVALAALWPANRPLRWLNVLLGAWLLWAPWLLLYQGMDLGTRAMLSDLAVGVVLLFLAPIGHSEHEPFGGWLRRVWAPPPPRPFTVPRQTGGTIVPLHSQPGD